MNTKQTGLEAGQGGCQGCGNGNCGGCTEEGIDLKITGMSAE